MLRLLSIAALLLCNTGCREISYPPPPQRAQVRHSIRAVLEMAPGAEQPWASVIQDVLAPAPGVDWRWARNHPRFRFALKDYEGWRLVVRMTAAGKVLDAVGPQTVNFTVNGFPVGKATLTKSGLYELAFAVDSPAMRAAAPIVAGLDISPCLIANSPPDAGLSYCVLLHSIGFVRDAR